MLRAQKDFVTETYTYDAADRLHLVQRDGYVIDQRRYDGAGRLAQSAPVALPSGYAEALNEGVAPSEQLGLGASGSGPTLCTASTARTAAT